MKPPAIGRAGLPPPVHGLQARGLALPWRHTAAKAGIRMTPLVSPKASARLTAAGAGPGEAPS